MWGKVEFFSRHGGSHLSLQLYKSGQLPQFFPFLHWPSEMGTKVNNVPAIFPNTVKSKPLIPLPAEYLCNRFDIPGRVPWSASCQSDYSPSSSAPSALSARHDAPVSITDGPRTQPFSTHYGPALSGDIKTSRFQGVTKPPKHRASQSNVPDSVSKSTAQSTTRQRTIHACEHCRERKTKVCP